VIQRVLVLLLLPVIVLIGLQPAYGAKSQEDNTMSSPSKNQLEEIEKALRTFCSGVGLAPTFQYVDGRLEVEHRLTLQPVLFRTGKASEATWETRQVMAPSPDGFRIEIWSSDGHPGQAVRGQLLSSRSPDDKPIYETYLGAAQNVEYNFSYGLNIKEEIRRGIQKAIEVR
jgi:hypothetical protein